MKVYLNDLSCGNIASCLLDNFDKIIRFSDLIEHVNKNFGTCRVIIDNSFMGLRVCDMLMAECCFNRSFNFDKRSLIQQLGNYFCHNEEIDHIHVFIHKGSKEESKLLGNAHEYSRPSISFTFDSEFETPLLEGTKDGKEAVINNLYDKEQFKDSTHSPFKPGQFISRNDCKQYKPLESPLWNHEATEAYHDENQGQLDSIKKHPEEKIAKLCRYADIVAQLNGWELDEGLSKLNTTTTKYRRIYRAVKFPVKNAYLSVDFEKPEIHFELHDKRGKHMGEYKWDGTKSGEKDPTGKHDITVK